MHGSCVEPKSYQDVEMERADCPDQSKFTKEQREQFDRLPINLTRVLLNCPVEMVKSFLDFGLSVPNGKSGSKTQGASDSEDGYLAWQFLRTDASSPGCDDGWVE